MRTPKLATLTLICAALAGIVASTTPGAALAQNVPSYGTPAARQEVIRGTVTGFDGAYLVYMRDERGYNDSVTMHQGTVINPTGIRLVEGMRVSIWGYANGPTFDAYQIEVAGGGPYYAGYYGYPNYGSGYGYGYGGYGYGYGYPYYPAVGIGIGIGLGWGWGWGGPWGWGAYRPWGWGWGAGWYHGPYGWYRGGYYGGGYYRGGYYRGGYYRGGYYHGSGGYHYPGGLHGPGTAGRGGAPGGFHGGGGGHGGRP
jgi:hypothetical protein